MLSTSTDRDASCTKSRDSNGPLSTARHTKKSLIRSHPCRNACPTLIFDSPLSMIRVVDRGAIQALHPLQRAGYGRRGCRRTSSGISKDKERHEILADDKLPNTNSFRPAQHHSAYAPLISFVLSLGNGRMILENNLCCAGWN